jgi:hypothetical protein
MKKFLSLLLFAFVAVSASAVQNSNRATDESTLRYAAGEAEQSSTRELLESFIELLEKYAPDLLKEEIAAAKEALANNDEQAMQNALKNLITASITKVSTILAEAKTFADNYGYTELARAIDELQRTIPIAVLTGNYDSLVAALQKVAEEGGLAAQDVVNKMCIYAETLDNEELNAAIANAKTALESGNLSEIIPAINAIGEPFIAATKEFIAKLQNIDDADVQAALAEVTALLNAENPNIPNLVEAVGKLITAYKAYLDKQSQAGINTIATEKLTKTVIFNLKGQRVENATKGLYIVNGKKVVLK